MIHFLRSCSLNCISINFPIEVCASKCEDGEKFASKYWQFSVNLLCVTSLKNCKIPLNLYSNIISYLLKIHFNITFPPICRIYKRFSSSILSVKILYIFKYRYLKAAIRALHFVPLSFRFPTNRNFSASYKDRVPSCQRVGWIFPLYT